jgi:hypothetical protein
MSVPYLVTKPTLVRRCLNLLSRLGTGRCPDILITVRACVRTCVYVWGCSKQGLSYSASPSLPHCTCKHCPATSRHTSPTLNPESRSDLETQRFLCGRNYIFTYLDDIHSCNGLYSNPVPERYRGSPAEYLSARSRCQPASNRSVCDSGMSTSGRLMFASLNRGGGGG